MTVLWDPEQEGPGFFKPIPGAIGPWSYMFNFEIFHTNSLLEAANQRPNGKIRRDSIGSQPDDTPLHHSSHAIESFSSPNSSSSVIRQSRRRVLRRLTFPPRQQQLDGFAAGFSPSKTDYH